MAQLLGLVILSFFITAMLLVPFIDFLYKVKLRRQKQETRDPFNQRTPLFDKYHGWKVGTPIGGGILVIIVVSVLTVQAILFLNIPTKVWEMFVIFFAFIGYGLLGFYDDLKKLVSGKGAFFGLRFRHKLIIQIVLALIIASVFYFQLGYSFIFLHGFGLIPIGIFFIPFAAFVIVAFTRCSSIFVTILLLGKELKSPRRIHRFSCIKGIRLLS